MSKQHFASGGSENRRQTLPPAMVNKPILMVSAAAIFSLFAAVLFTLLDQPSSTARSERTEPSPPPPASKIADKSSRLDVEGPPPQVFAQPPAERIDAPAPLQVPAPAPASTRAFTPVPPIVNRGADPVSIPSAGPIAGESAEVKGKAPIERRVAAIDPEETRPRQSISSKPGVPLECLPSALRTVLTDIEARFGPLTIVSTTHLHTENHSRGSIREKLHRACRAVDIRTPKEPKELIAYLRSRPEVGGVNTYRNRVIHFDMNANYKPTAGNRRAALSASARRRASSRR